MELYNLLDPARSERRHGLSDSIVIMLLSGAGDDKLITRLSVILQQKDDHDAQIIVLWHRSIINTAKRSETHRCIDVVLRCTVASVGQA
jgi:hypothetical protein